MPHPRLAILCCLLLCSFLLSCTRHAETVGAPGDGSGITERVEAVGWLGDGSASYPDADPPTTWDEKKNVLWRTQVGSSYASPVLYGDRLLVTAEPDTVCCVAAADGKMLWSKAISPADLPADQQGRLVPPGQGKALAGTPVCDGERVYVVSATGQVAAFALADGKLAWTRVVGGRVMGEGRSCSPVRVGKLLVVCLTELHGLDAATGKDVWTNPDVHETYGTPLPGRIGDADVLFTPMGGVVRASDGKAVATIDNVRLMYASPVRAGKMIGYCDTYFGFYKLPASLGPGAKLDTYWEDQIPGQTFTTAQVCDGLAYLVTADGQLIVLDIEKKQVLPPMKLELHANVYPSPVRAGKYLFVGNDQRKTIVLTLGREPKIVATNELGDGSGGTPVFAGKRIYLRSGDDLCCIAAP